MAVDKLWLLDVLAVEAVGDLHGKIHLLTTLAHPFILGDNMFLNVWGAQQTKAKNGDRFVFGVGKGLAICTSNGEGIAGTTELKGQEESSLTRTAVRLIELQ